jgi:hypothetical protein
MKRFIFCLLGVVGFAASASAQFIIENPIPGSHQSGIGLVFGWKCTGSNMTAVVDGVYTLILVYGSDRLDTQGQCGDRNNGFGILVNWNSLSNGQHTIRFYDNGVEFASVTFTVQTLGEQFLRDRSKTVTVPDFPNAGQTTTLQWSEAAQNFVITGLSGGGGGEYPNVAGTWRVSLDFLTEDCNFLSVPPDLPTHVTGTLSVTQSGGNLTVRGGSILYEGDLETDGGFSIVADPAVDTAGSCTFAIVQGYAGNFLDGDVIYLLAADRVSGSCVGVTLPCGVIYEGSITRQSTAAQSAPEAEDSPVAQLRERMREALGQ